MVQFLAINIFLGFLQFPLGFSKVPVFCATLYLYTTLWQIGVKFMSPSLYYSLTRFSSKVLVS